MVNKKNHGQPVDHIRRIGVFFVWLVEVDRVLLLLQLDGLNLGLGRSVVRGGDEGDRGRDGFVRLVRK